MNELLFILWNPDTIICHLGPVAIRWYSTCWLIGLLLAYFLVRHMFREQKLGDEKFEPLFLYCFLGILIGARLGHCLLYEPGYFLSSGTHIIEMLLPIRYGMDNAWHFTGYEGLASHGGTAGIIIALLLYCRQHDMRFWMTLDFIAIVAPLTACFIRLGNLMNSEIIGMPTGMPWGFIFERVDMLPRHPSQLYEALAYLIIFTMQWWMYKHWGNKTDKTPSGLLGTGWYFGFTMASIFLFRFFIEYTKEVQVDFEHGMLFDMGQLLSVPFVLIGAGFMWYGWRKAKVKS